MTGAWIGAKKIDKFDGKWKNYFYSTHKLYFDFNRTFSRAWKYTNFSEGCENISINCNTIEDVFSEFKKQKE